MTKARGNNTSGGGVMAEFSRTTIKEIAAVLGIPLRTAGHRALKGRWRFDEEIIPTGAKRRLYPLAKLPLDVKAPIILDRMGLPGSARWLTAAEIVGLGLFDTNAAFVRAKAEIHAWPRRQRGRHGMEYPLADVVAPELITALQVAAGQIDPFQGGRHG